MNKQNGNSYSRYLGEVGWNCMWAPTGAGAEQLVPCQGIITTVSSSKMAAKQPLSTAVVSFWTAEKYLDGDVATAQLVTPTVVRSTGSWPKPDAFSSFGWNAANGQLYLNIHYKKGTKAAIRARVMSSNMIDSYFLIMVLLRSTHTHSRLQPRVHEVGVLNRMLCPWARSISPTVGLSGFGAG